MSGDDDEVDGFIRKNRRAVTLRFVGVGGALVAAGLALYFYGSHLDELQASAEVKFSLPYRLMLVGAVGAGIGALLLAIGAIRLVRL